MDRRAVTNAEFAAFVKREPRWSRAKLSGLFADPGYLAHWRTEDDPGPSARAPVVAVSWFAARAFCAANNAKLPTIAQWERAAAASETTADASRDPAHTASILKWYGEPRRDAHAPAAGQPNFFGIADLHGGVWEWVEDFNSAMASGESRGGDTVDPALFCGGGSLGAADPSDYAAFMRAAFRASLKARFTINNLGFRCVRELPSPGPK